MTDYTKFAFTGTRKGMTQAQKRNLRDILKEATLIHNGSARGADFEAALIARNLGLAVVAHPASGVSSTDKIDIPWASAVREPQPPIIRNRNMVDEAEQLIATPYEEHEQYRGSGTWATIRYARKTKTPMIILWPNGKISKE